jgi:hypothetical protein
LENSGCLQMAEKVVLATSNVADNPAMQTQATTEDSFDKGPRELAWAEKHREANTAKNPETKNLIEKDVQNEELY